ncbi:hypothetical protein L226DRAFT_573815 [Lentinus tigrinus ALCF2SS1-7]|uniref:uncharacterized protein n=1 Tax=Lentinus tigrinus ALCF2SS1-7 TaxID=1328758 RepID=UPI001165DC65|nr:hypothetical protein L226DRAFT_573815 [Lentinus tigrinus ALCF2SS1-7]
MFDTPSSTRGSPASYALNLDTLQDHLVVPRQDLLSASCTSSLVRNLEIRDLLSRPVSLHTPHDLQRWCQFVLAEENRPAQVRDLYIHLQGLGSLSKKRSTLLLRVLQRAKLLRRLFISWADAVIDANPEIPSAISRLPALESFEAAPFSEDTHATISDILANMDSRLKFLSLRTGLDSDDLEWLYDVPRVLAPHLEHLEELRLASPDGRTPAIRSRTLNTLRVAINKEQPRPSELSQAFPNLRNLIISADAINENPFKAVPEDRYDTLRNYRVVEQTGNRVWPSLDTLRGKVAPLYVLGLTCPVRRLELKKYRSSRHHMAVEVLRYACPSKLILGIQSVEALTMGHGEASLLVPQSPDRPHVTHLTIRLDPKDVAPSTQDLLDDFIPFLQRSKVEYLHISIPKDIGEHGELEDHWFIYGPARECALALDLDLLRDGIIGAVASLRVLAFTVVVRGKMLWTVDRSGGSPTTTEVEAVVAKGLIRCEEA